MTPPLAIIWHSAFFWLFAFVTCAFAAAVVFTSNVVRMAFYLTLSLGATAGLFFLAGAEFVGAMQLLIYVGGTLVLLIFGVMLTAQGPFVTMKTKGGEWVLASLIGGSLLVLLLYAAFSVERWYPGPEGRAKLLAQRESFTSAEARDTVQLGVGLVGPRIDKPNTPGAPSYLLLFELASVHLLVVLVGAAYLARAKRRSTVEAVAAVADRPRGQHSLPVLAWLALGIAGNGFAALHGFVGWPPLPPEAAEHLSGAKDWLMPAIAVGFVANVVLLLVVASWQKWGLFGMLAVALVQAGLVLQSGLPLVCGALFLVAALVPVVVLLGLLKYVGSPTSWARMD